MNIVKKMSKKKLLETYKNNYQLMLNRKNELYDKNIELQKKVLEQQDIINELKKEKKVLKAKLTKALKQIDRFESIEVAQSIEQGNYIIENLFKEGDK
jgi:predicted nuclease with TOPRIM domain